MASSLPADPADPEGGDHLVVVLYLPQRYKDRGRGEGGLYIRIRGAGGSGSYISEFEKGCKHASVASH